MLILWIHELIMKALSWMISWMFKHFMPVSWTKKLVVIPSKLLGPWPLPDIILFIQVYE